MRFSEFGSGGSSGSTSGSGSSSSNSGSGSGGNVQATLSRRKVKKRHFPRSAGSGGFQLVYSEEPEAEASTSAAKARSTSDQSPTDWLTTTYVFLHNFSTVTISRRVSPALRVLLVRCFLSELSLCCPVALPLFRSAVGSLCFCLLYPLEPHELPTIGIGFAGLSVRLAACHCYQEINIFL